MDKGEEAILAEMSPIDLRALLYKRSLQILEKSAPTDKKMQSIQRPTDVLEDITETFDYEPWDLAFVAALTALTHPRTRVPQALRTETARITKERRRLVQELRRFQKKFMAGPAPTVAALGVVLAPRPAVGCVYATGRPREWALDLFAGAIRTILAEVRVSTMPELPLEPVGLAFGYGRELLGTLGVHVSPENLSERARTLSDSLPAPTDEAPWDWANAVFARFFAPQAEGRAVLRRLLTPDGELPIQTLRYRLRAGTDDIFVRAFRRRALPQKPS